MKRDRPAFWFLWFLTTVLFAWAGYLWDDAGQAAIVAGIMTLIATVYVGVRQEF